jgi:hypothetical protein
MLKSALKIFLPFCLLPLGAACGPDARRDNPLDPVNGRGVSGTAYSLLAIPVAGILIRAEPGNALARTNSSGEYALTLEAGRSYQVTASGIGFLSRTDTLAIPNEGRLKHNFILKGIPWISSGRVLTRSVYTADGQLPVYSLPQAVVRHPDGQADLERLYQVKCRARGITYLADSSRLLDQVSRLYHWRLDTSLRAGDTVTVFLDSAGTAVHQQFQAVVPSHLGFPTIISPANNSSFALPGTLVWNNAPQFFITTRVEIWSDTMAVWSRDLSNVEQTYCDAVLEGGRDYLWKVINTDAEGNQGIAEARFHLP